MKIGSRRSDRKEGVGIAHLGIPDMIGVDFGAAASEPVRGREPRAMPSKKIILKES